MSKSNAFENAMLLLIANNTNIANLGDATGIRGSTTVGSLYWALHTADPGEAGDQSTSEISYTGYARVAAARNSGGLVVTANVITPAANVDFGERTDAASSTATHASLGIAASGGGMILWSGPITPNIVVTQGSIPRLKTTSTITED